MLAEDDFDAASLFRAMTDDLGGGLAEAMASGITRPLFTRLLRVCRLHLKEIGTPIQARKLASGSMPTDEFWRRLGDHQRRHGDGSVIVGLSGKYNHWTCVRHLSARTMYFIDSGPGLIYRLHRSRLSLRWPPCRVRLHVVQPNETFLLSRVKY